MVRRLERRRTDPLNCRNLSLASFPAACWILRLCPGPHLGAEVSGRSCGMVGMVGMPGTPGTRGPLPDTNTHTPSAAVACLCVCVSIQSGQAKKKRSRLSSSDTFTRRQGPTCACLFHEDSHFTRRLVCAHTLQPAITCSPCTCPHQDISPQFPHPPTSRLTSPPPPLCRPGLHHCPVEASWKSPSTTGSGRSLPVHSDNHHPAARSAQICPARPTVSIFKEENRPT